jgi:acyl dehydratase
MGRIFWEDLTDGMRLPCRTVSFDRRAIIEFAQEFDPQPFHIDEDAARGSIFGGLVASSLHTLAACTRSVVDSQERLAILAGVGMDAVEMFNAVRPGDILAIEAHWTELRRSQSKPDRGYATLKCKVSNQRGDPVIEYGYRYLVACRDGCDGSSS